MLKALQDQYRKARQEAAAIRDKYKATPDAMTPEEAATWEKWIDEADRIEKRIKMVEADARQEAYAAESAGQLPLVGKSAAQDVERKAAGTDESPAAEIKVADPALASALKAAQQPGYKQALLSYIVSAAKGAGMNLMTQAEIKVLSEGSDTAGGFLAPPDFQAELLKRLPGLTAIRPLARTVPTSRDRLVFPKVNYTTDDKYTSPVRITWTGEVPASATAADVTDPVFGQEVIPIHTAMAAMSLTNDMIEDSAFDILAYANSLLSEAYALDEEDAFINGIGVGKPEGLVFSSGANFPTYVPLGGASDFASSNPGDYLWDLYFAVPAQYRMRGQWVMSSSTAKSVRKMKDANGRYLWDDEPSVANGNLTTGEQRTLCDKPVSISEFMPTVAANAYPILFGDLTGYVIGDRVGLSIQVLRETKAKLNQIELLARRRVGGGIVEPYKLRVGKIATS